MSKHTAGPWYVERIGELNIYVRSSSEYGARVAKIEILTKPTEEEDLANAHLIAAAPELLEACETVIPSNVSLTNKNIPDDFIFQLDVSMGELRKIAAAIAKARGEA